MTTSFSQHFTKAFEAGELLTAGEEMPANVPFTIRVPATGDYTDAKGNKLPNGALVQLAHPSGGTAPADIANITPAEVAVLEAVGGVGGDTGEIVETTDGQALEWGTQYWMHPAFNYTFPAVTQTANDNWLRGYPSNFDWRAFTGTWTGNGTDTIGAGQQPLAALSDAVTFIGSLGAPSNISMHVGGGSAAEVGLPAYVNLADVQGAGIAGRLFRATGTGDLAEGAYYMQSDNIPVGPIS